MWPDGDTIILLERGTGSSYCKPTAYIVLLIMLPCFRAHGAITAHACKYATLLLTLSHALLYEAEACRQVPHQVLLLQVVEWELQVAQAAGRM